jgi:DnaJ-class molecular chaperone with C-terminal Zn finger domain
MADIHADYKRLNLKIGASIAEVKAAYRTLAKRWHPDQFSDLEQKQQAEEELKKINDAYQKIKAFLAENPSSQTEPNSQPSDRPNSAQPTNHSPSESSSPQTRIYTSGASAAEAFYQTGADLTKQENMKRRSPISAAPLSSIQTMQRPIDIGALSIL